MDNVPEAALRRYQRVAGSVKERTYPEELLEDFRDLIRAIEALLPRAEPENQGRIFARSVSAGLQWAGVANCPGIAELIKKGQRFASVSDPELAEWFGGTSGDIIEARKAIKKWQGLKEALAAPQRWHSRDGERLGHLLYQMRGSIVHDGLQTTNPSIPSILAAARSALLTLTVIVAAEQRGMTAADMQKVFDAF